MEAEHHKGADGALNLWLLKFKQLRLTDQERVLNGNYLSSLRVIIVLVKI